MNKLCAYLLMLTTAGCGPHHITTTQITITKYKCVNWLQTVAMCDTLEECNKICKEAAEKK